ncbi:MAG: HAMP domain-containing protein, partial [Kiritimatiellaeota bacterium]|nr:HAMP domain-containing protein [Kiritimatiellota bacterium]
MMRWWSQLNFKTKLILFALGIVLLATLCSALGAISLNYQQTRARNTERLSIAVAAIQQRLERVAAELDRRYAVLARDESFNDSMLAVITGPSSTFRMIPLLHQLGPGLDVVRFAFYGPQLFPGPNELQLYYDHDLGGLVQVKNNRHLLCPAGSLVDREIGDRHLFPATPDMIPPCAVIVENGQLHWLARYEFRRCTDTMPGRDKVQRGELVGMFVMQSPAQKLDLANLGKETGVSFVIYDANGRKISGQTDLDAAIAGYRSTDQVTVFKNRTGEKYDTLGQPIEHDGRLAGFVLATIPRTATARQNLRMVGLLLAIALVVCVLMVPLAWRSVARFIRPVEVLMRASAEMAAGRLEGRIETGSQDEFGRLARSFDLMRASIKAQMAQAERLTAIIEAAPDLILTMAPDGQLTYLNDAGRQLLGWPEGTTTHDKRFADIYPLAVLDTLWKQAIPHALQAGVWQGETRLLGAGGREIPVQQIIMAHYAAAGQVEYFSSIMRDLSAAKQAEAALRANEEYLSITLNSIGDAVISTDLQGRV